MEQLRYVIEDSTIAILLGTQNFSTDESAILELVKNAYDACALSLEIEFDKNSITITDNGTGMSADDIRTHWMHIGISSKEYSIVDDRNSQRVLAGSKGIGRFALARLGERVCVYSKKDNYPGIIWSTDWSGSTLTEDNAISTHGTKIVINNLREKWNKNRIRNLVTFLSRVYNDTTMSIKVLGADNPQEVLPYFPIAEPGVNCQSLICFEYDGQSQILKTHIVSDEFSEEAAKYCNGTDIHKYCFSLDMKEELKYSSSLDVTELPLSEELARVGSFSGEFYFNDNHTAVDSKTYLYKHTKLLEQMPEGVILYRNAFSISSFDGKKDWLGFGKRSRRSPAGPTHPTGAWRVRENQISGKVLIDKKENAVLQDLSNRQGFDENRYFELFIEIILSCIAGFERYRQNIIRAINQNNKGGANLSTPIADYVIKKPNSMSTLSSEQAHQLVAEIKALRKETKTVKDEKAIVESRYKYDVRILNVLATIGLKAASIAHGMRTDKNTIAENTQFVIDALKEYGYWEDLQSKERTMTSYNNVPYLLEANMQSSTRVLAFINTMLSDVEKSQFNPKLLNVHDVIEVICQNWLRDYAWVSIELLDTKDIQFYLAEDVLKVILDNLILNSIQQNENSNQLRIIVSVEAVGELLSFSYSDDGKGLDKKYKGNPERILEVHETTRKNGHGLGMWIVNNTVTMSGGQIVSISEGPGFSIRFTVGRTK